MDDELLWGIGILLALRALGEWDTKVVPALQQKGAEIYDKVHNDAGHRKDLPGKQMTKAQIVDLAARAGFPDPKLAAAIAMAESGGVPNALGDFRDGKFISIGLWQINVRAHPKYDRVKLANPQYNADAAWNISQGGRDWTPWSTFKNGTHLRHL